MVPAEQILPMRDAKRNVHLVSPENLELYRGLTGLIDDYAPDNSGRRGKAATQTMQCVNPVHNQQARTRTHCGCGQEIYSLAQLVRARDDLCERCRIKLGHPAPRIPS